MNEVPLYRNGPKGQPAEWRCDFHLDKPADDEVATVAQAISDVANDRKPL